MDKKIIVQLILPVRGDERSVEKAKAAKAYYEKRGFEVVDPHVIAAAVTDENGAENEAKTQAFCKYQLADADLAVLLPGWENSEGCQNEIIFATAHGIPLYFHKSNIRVFFNTYQRVEIESQRPGDIITPEVMCNEKEV